MNLETIFLEHGRYGFEKNYDSDFFSPFFISSRHPICNAAETIQTPPKGSTVELYQDIIVSLLMPHIDKQINEYYKRFYNYTPTVYPYQVKIVHAERMDGYRSFKFLLNIQTQAVVGPHIDVGFDLMTFEVQGSGKVQLEKFEHIRSFELPPNWQHINKVSRRALYWEAFRSSAFSKPWYREETDDGNRKRV